MVWSHSVGFPTTDIAIQGVELYNSGSVAVGRIRIASSAVKEESPAVAIDRLTKLRIVVWAQTEPASLGEVWGVIWNPSKAPTDWSPFRIALLIYSSVPEVAAGAVFLTVYGKNTGTMHVFGSLSWL